MTEPLEEIKPNYIGEEEVESFNFIEYWRILTTHKWIVSGTTLIGLVVGVIHFANIPDSYDTSVKMLVEKTDQTPKSNQELRANSDPSIAEGEEVYYNTQIAIMTGRDARAKVESELRASVGYEVNARRVRDTRIIEISVECGEPEWAAKIANKFAEIYIRDSVQSDSYVSQQILKMIPESGEITENKEFVDKLTGFDKKLYAESLSSITDDSELSTLRGKKLETEVRLKDLSDRYLPEHPEVIQAEGQLSYLNSQIKERTAKILNNMRANLAGKVNITNVRVLESAEVPTSPSAPNRPRGIMTWTLLGLLLGGIIAFIIESTNRKVWVAKDLYPTVPITFLGYVPLIKELNQNKNRLLRHAAAPVPLIEIMAKHTLLADMIASIRTHILFSMPFDKSKRIMFTSAIPDEGKSSVSIFLALSLVSMGRNILLVDADMRRPFLHSYLGLDNQKGLSDYLIGAATAEEVIKSVPGSNLKVITGGRPTLNPTELLSSERFRSLLDNADKTFDRIVIDVPPVLCIPDGLVVAKYVHSGVLVCGSGMVVRKVIKTVIDKFEAIGHKFIGVVINRAGYETEGYYKYRYASSYKKYYQHQEAAAKKSGPKITVVGR